MDVVVKHLFGRRDTNVLVIPSLRVETVVHIMEDHKTKMDITQEVHIKRESKVWRQARVVDAYQSVLADYEKQENEENNNYIQVQVKARQKEKQTKPSLEKYCPSRLASLLTIDENMLPYKLLYIFFRGGLACITPYLAVRMSQRGFGPLQAGLMASIAAFLSAFVTPLLGYIADKYQCRKGLLLTSICLWMLLTCSLNFLESPEQATCPEAYGHLTDTIGLSGPHKAICRRLAAKHKVESLIVEPLHVLHVPELVVNFSAACPTEHTDQSELDELIHRFEPTNLRHGRDDLIQAFRSPENYKRHRAATGTNRSWMYEAISLQKTFSYVFLLITFGEVMQGTVLFLTDTATLHRLGPKNRGLYGWQRSFGSAGYAVYALSLDELLNMARVNVVVCGIVVPITDYRIATVIFVGTVACAFALIVASCFKLRYIYGSPFTYRFENMQPAFFSFHYGSIVLTAFFLAICNGCTDGYLFTHLTKLGATQYILGMVLAVRGGSELLVASYTSYLIKYFGHVPLLFVGLGAYFVRFSWYSVLGNPLWCIPAEVINGISVALTWNIFTSYMSESVPSQNLATLQGFITGIYHGLGRGIGLLLAGLMVESFGTFTTFALFAVGCVLYAIFFFVIQRSSEQPSGQTYLEYVRVPTGMEDSFSEIE